MTEQKLIELILAAFPGAEVSVALNGGHVDITVISADFAGMRPVARQQRVYAPLAALIADGTLHAVNISAVTPDADG
ncbi:BolA/IbaG family iron-sulfur metabolism protein [Luminiphilus sp.]|nr:BolA/IbaG family iron-sulfur metabolism protein [Luminiphilus sp.]MDB4048929.1 BolA/IbaG family iron-sulfur metabolism protein [Luminiphilus sp.]MDC1117181.1 BolA/IbaG family iron-sulfur metabolism protein [Luminiphilus sp.]